MTNCLTHFTHGPSYFKVSRYHEGPKVLAVTSHLVILICVLSIVWTAAVIRAGLGESDINHCRIMGAIKERARFNGCHC